MVSKFTLIFTFIFLSKLIFREYPKKCIYGIKITNGFDNFLYYNDPEKDANIAKQLDLVGFDLCNYVEPIGSDPFQQVVIRVNFFTDCYYCKLSKD